MAFRVSCCLMATARIGYPPHCTHALQGLDVVCFAKMKASWQASIVAFESKTMRDVSKAEFLSVWAPAYVEAFQSKLCHRGADETQSRDVHPCRIPAAAAKPCPRNHHRDAPAAPDSF